MPMVFAEFEQRTLREAAVANAAGTVTGEAISGFGKAVKGTFVLDVTAAATEAGDTLAVFIDTSYDGGANWVNVLQFPTVLGNGGAKRFVATVDPVQAAAPVDVTADAAANTIRAIPLGDRVRVRHTIVDVATLANVSFNFAVRSFLRGA